jgi:hypothetical protein
MSGHLPSVAPNEIERGKVTNLLAEKHARRREWVRAQPILGARCPGAQVRIFDFSTELHGGGFTRDGLQSASETTLECVQDEYRGRRSHLDDSAFFELHHARLWAIHALSLLTGSHAHAKRFELKITDDHPLTVCGGTGPWFPAVSPGLRKLQPVQTFWGEVLHVPALGCHAIIPESTRLGGVMWRYWCDDCSPSKGQKSRSQVRAHRRRVEAWAIERLNERSKASR